MRRGFTLIELAIVLVIIGLLVGGILAGQELVQQAKINRTIREINVYYQAVNVFYSKYAKLPGDMNNASRMLGSTYNGAGDGIIDSDINGNSPEPIAAWNHLSLAGLIPGFEQVTSWNISDTQNWLDNNILPAAQGFKGGGYSFTPKTDVYGGTNAVCPVNGLLLGMSSGVAARFHDGGAFRTPVVPVAQAKAIDIKMDDGIAYSGKIKGFNRNAAILCAWSRLSNVAGNIATDYNLGPGGDLCEIIYCFDSF